MEKTSLIYLGNEIASEIEEFRKKAYQNDNMLPKRYCFVLTTFVISLVVFVISIGLSSQTL